MISLVADRTEEIAALCRQHQVQRLDLFGSAATPTPLSPVAASPGEWNDLRPSPPTASFLPIPKPQVRRMTDSLLTPQLQEEALSRVYVHAVAAVAGYTISNRDFDTDGVDLHIDAGGHMRPALDIQLKATTGLRILANSELRYDLRVRNYDLLRIEDLQTPRLLIVLDLPKTLDEWLTVSHDVLELRRCAYWVDLKGYPDANGEKSADDKIAITVEKENLFDTTALQDLMELSRKGRIT